jgi:FkbM family methyltransferase
VAPLISYAQNSEDIRVWRAFHAPVPGRAVPVGGFTYVDVGANEPRHLSITASLYDLGWRGLLIEADPQLAKDLRTFRPMDTVVECAASDVTGTLTFHTVPGTGLGTLNSGEAGAAADRGFETIAVTVPARRLDDILAEYLKPKVGVARDIHFMSIDVEGAEATVLSGLSLVDFRPWVLCIEAVHPGTNEPSQQEWEPALLRQGYLLAAFDGVNRWYVAVEHEELLAAVATPFNSLDAGMVGWQLADQSDLARARDRAHARRAWQRELILNDIGNAVPTAEYEKQINELRTALITVEGSRSWRYTRKAGRVARGVQHRIRVAMMKMPGPAQRTMIRERHLRHVTANLEHLIDPAYLGKAPKESVSWITAAGMPELPGVVAGIADPSRAGFGLGPLTNGDERAIQDWLAAGPYDDDATLDHRTDNHDDELGRLMAALRLRLRLNAAGHAAVQPTVAAGNRVLIDARSMQSAAFGARGIGRFASSALLGVREALGDAKIVLLIDPALEVLPADLAGDCEQIVRVLDGEVGRFSVLIEPSPMTASPEPLVPLLRSTAHKIAIIFDFIPMHYPSVYLRHAAARAEYAAGLDALRHYNEFVCISHLAKDEVAAVLGNPNVDAKVAWPASITGTRKVKAGNPTGPIVVMTGDEGRKNTYGALAAIGAATAGSDDARDVLVIGMAGQETRVHHWSIHAAMRPGEAVTAGRITDADMHEALNSASVVVIPSFDEGLSLPVIEAISCGANVVASDIPAHRELIGKGPYLVDPRNMRAFAKVIRKYAGTRRSYPRQQAQLAAHSHEVLEKVLVQSTLAKLGKTMVALSPAKIHAAGQALSVGFATPWTPQRSGIADFSDVVARELNKICDLTIYTTSGATVEGLKHASIDSVIAKGSAAASDHDVFVTVVGNSHFHVPFIEVMKTIDCVAVAHDTRMIEYYLAMRDRGGVQQLMLRGTDHRALSPSLDEQIGDMRLLQNMGFWEIAHRAKALVMHSPSAAPWVEQQTGITPYLLPFANYRAPETSEVTKAMRRDARARAGMRDGVIHLATFGYVDVRTKMVDVIVEAAAWLTMWGHQVSLHFIGAATWDLNEELTKRANDAGIAEFEITGFVSDEVFRDYVLGVDLGIQLRVSPLLGVSGPLSDMAAVGTPAVASLGLAVDVDTPAFIDRLPDEASPLMVAEAIERRLANPRDPSTIERERREYLVRKSPALYAEQLLAILNRVRT